jgi:hypothetical protein
MALKFQSREIVGLVAVKLAALAVIYALFFSPGHRPVVDAQARLLGPPAPSTLHR